MTRLFQSKPLHLAACILLFWKGISIIVWLLLLDAHLFVEDPFFWSTGFAFITMLALVAGFEGSYLLLIALGILIVVYWVLFVLLAINRAGANAASIVLLIFCALDIPFTLLCSLSQWWSLFICIIFHMTLLITLVLMRRSRPGIPEPLNKIPDEI